MESEWKRKREKWEEEINKVIGMSGKRDKYVLRERRRKNRLKGETKITCIGK